MNCLRAQSEISRGQDDGTPLPFEAERHLSTCDECAGFRETSAAFELRYRMQVRSGIERLRRLEAAPFRAGRPVWKRLAISVAAALLVCGWGLANRAAEVPSASSSASTARATPAPQRSLLFDDAGFLEKAGPELSFLQVGEPRLPFRLDQDLHGIGGPDPDLSLPRNLRFRN